MYLFLVGSFESVSTWITSALSLFCALFFKRNKDFPYLSRVGEHRDGRHKAGRQRQGDGHGRQLPSAHQKVRGAPLAPVHPGVVDADRGGHHEHESKHGVVCRYKGAH